MQLNFIVSDDHFKERMMDNFDNNNVDELLNQLYENITINSFDNNDQFHRFLKCVEKQSGVKIFDQEDGDYDRMLCFKAACHYYFGY